MFCPNCGKEQIGDSSFCYNCGQRLLQQELKPDIGTELPYTKQEQNTKQNNTTETPETGKIKKRHGCLMAYLIFLIVVVTVVGIYYVADASYLKSTLGLPEWTLPVLVVLCVLEIVCAFALLKWKKWGFWGFCALAVIALIVNISSGLEVTSSLTGLVGIAVMYGVLNIGDKENKGWTQLD